MSKEEPWTKLPIDLGIVPRCKKHHKFCELKKIDDTIGYGFFCPECEKERENEST